jgi:hypothetical protein
MIATCTGWLLAVGGTTALGKQWKSLSSPYDILTTRTDALGSKAFTGEADKSMIGVYLQKCLISMTIGYIPVALLWCFIGPVLVACGQPHDLAYGTQTFLRCLTPCGLGYIYFESMKKFLQCQSEKQRGLDALRLQRLTPHRHSNSRKHHPVTRCHRSRSHLLGGGPRVAFWPRRRCHRHWKHVLAGCVANSCLYLLH